MPLITFCFVMTTAKRLLMPLTCENAKQDEDRDEQGNSVHYDAVAAAKDASLDLSA
jgi:hypothetical protein